MVINFVLGRTTVEENRHGGNQGIVGFGWKLVVGGWQSNWAIPMLWFWLDLFYLIYSKSNM